MVTEVQESQSVGDLKTKRSYTSYTDENRVVIGKYDVENGNAAALRHFKPHFMELGESTVKSFKRKYLAAVKENRGPDHPTDVTAIPSKMRDKPLPLEEMDRKVQKYIKALREAGTPVSLPLVMAAAKGIISSKDRSLLAENGGHIALTTARSRSLMNRMGMVNRKATTSKPKYSPVEFESRKRSYLHAIVGMISTHAIPAELVVNWDQTGINLVPTSDYTVEERSAKRVKVNGLGDKRQVTATFAATMSGEFLPMQILYGGKTERVHPKFKLPDDFDVWHSPNHWSNQELCLRFVIKIIIPYVKKVKEEKGIPNQSALAIFDAFSGHQSEALNEVLEENQILIVKVPSGCTDELQPLDLSVNKSCKSYLRSKFSTWYASEVEKQLAIGIEAKNVKVDSRMQVIKELSAQWLLGFYDYMASRKEIVVNGFKEAGILAALEGQIETVPVENDEDDPFSDVEYD
jgi:hypothetical protein